MRQKNEWIMLLLVASSTGTVLRAQPDSCTQETLAGTYAVSIRGTVIAPGPGGTHTPVPIASLGVATIDSEGAVSLTGYQSIGGQVSPAQMKGAVTVKSDCTANAAFTDGIAGTLVVSGGANEMTFLMLAGGSLGSPIAFGDWKRISRAPNAIAQGQCAPDSLAGIYAYQSSGTVMVAQPGASQPLPVPVATVGIGSAIRGGTVAATATASVGGTIVPLEITSVAPVIVNSDCTASATVNVTSQGAPVGQHQDFFVVLDGGNILWDLTTKDFLGQSVELGSWTRISPTGRQ